MQGARGIRSGIVGIFTINPSSTKQVRLGLFKPCASPFAIVILYEEQRVVWSE